jgi:hypothetical protein
MICRVARASLEAAKNNQKKSIFALACYTPPGV